MKNEIKRLYQDIKATSKEVTNTNDVLKKDPSEKNELIFSDELENLALKREKLEDEIEFCKEEQNRLNDQHAIDNESYQDISDQFVPKWKMPM